MERDRWSRPVIEAAAEVHRILGPGLPESVYKLALPEELRRRKIPFEQDKTVPIRYRDLVLVTGLQLELVVGGELIVEVVSVERVTEWRRAQLHTHVRLSGCPAGLLINFNVKVLARGVRRVTVARP
ncbi:MAG TPA: GxxExxY protein [Myxococcales bacterium]|nr:GxxExxY protein [Myxococcales bacterium]